MPASTVATKPGERWQSFGIVSISAPTFVMLLYAVCTFVLRARTFGNPVLFSDEEFYLLVGQRMLHGALPYVDIWDRKPIGLFLLYALFADFGSGVLAYQIAAAVCISATAWLIYLAGRSIAPAPAAFLAGLAYPLYMHALQCYGGQAEVFYNLPVALAGFLILRQVADLPNRPSSEQYDTRSLMTSVAAMALMGCAVQIKTSVVFTALYFGMMLTLHAYKRLGSLRRTLALSLVWAEVAILPSQLAALYFKIIGKFNLYLFATVTSNIHRDFTLTDWKIGALKTLLTLAPVMAAAALGGKLALTSAGIYRQKAAFFLTGWLLAAVVGFLVLGPYYPFYRAPLLLPLLALAAAALGTTRWHAFASFCVLAVGGGLALREELVRTEQWGTIDQASAAVAKLSPMLGGRCLFLLT